MKEVVDRQTLPRYRPGPKDWLQLVYLGAAVLLVGFLGLFGFALIFNGITMFGWLFAAGFFLFRHGFLQYRNRLAVSGTATARASSAAIGLAELTGRGVAENTRKAPVSETPCLFWSVDLEQWQRRSKRRGWRNKLHRTFAVGTLEQGMSPWGVGHVYVYSGASQTPIRTFSGTNPGDLLGNVCDAADVDGDGTPDLLVGSAWANNGDGYVDLTTVSAVAEIKQVSPPCN